MCATTQLTKQHVQLVQKVNRLIRTVNPLAKCTSFMLMDSTAFRPHRDSRNMPGSKDYLIGLTAYDGGEL